MFTFTMQIVRVGVRTFLRTAKKVGDPDPEESHIMTQKAPL